MNGIKIRDGELAEQSQLNDNLSFDKEAGIVLFSLIEALSYEVMNEDIWWLANDSAKKNAIARYGISAETYDAVIKRIEVARKKVRASNPMSVMF